MVSARLAPFGSTVFSTITARARAAGAVDLGQGYPSWEGPDFIKDAAIDAIRSASNQYPPSMGLVELRTAVADRWRRDTGATLDPDTEVTITSGCTEALAATFLGLCEPGDGVILFEPAYDAYPVGCALAGAEPIFVTLHAPDFRFDEAELRAAFGRKPRAILVNTPHNPSGRVFGEDEMAIIAELCLEYDVVAVTDEVYERIIYEGDHLRLAAFPGMWDRTITLSSVGKSFSLTGWKTGWAIARPELTAAVRAAHQFLTFTTPNPMQLGTAAALAVGDDYYRELVSGYRRKRDLLVSGLGVLGFGVDAPAGTYYVLADHSPFGFADDRAFVDHLIDTVGVAAIPPSFFYHRSDEGTRLVRFAFCKDDSVLEEALARLEKLAR
jgi:aspartate/methionine/tyrosine aminotransferase